FFHHSILSIRYWRRKPFALRALPSGPFADDIVNNTVFLALVGRHDVVALGVVLDALDRLTGVVNQDLVDALTHAQNLAGCYINAGAWGEGANKGGVGG